MKEEERVSAEWVALSAFRGLAKLASRGDMGKSTYEGALDLGGVMYPELLGPENSILKKEHESDTAKEYRQRARLKSIRDNVSVDPLTILATDIGELEELLGIAKLEVGDRQRVDQLKNKLAALIKTRKELQVLPHTENQLIFRDAYNAERPEIRSLAKGRGYRDFELPNENILRLRVLHPERPEHITGADVIYERHSLDQGSVSIVAVQYKIWEDRALYLSEPRMNAQLAKMRGFLCDQKHCERKDGKNNFRFPYCSAFLRPTDKLQRADQKFISRGEHIPICEINRCTTLGERGARILEYSSMREVSLSNETFEFLFNTGKIGSDYIAYDDLVNLYSDFLVEASKDSVVIYAQEIMPDE